MRDQKKVRKCLYMQVMWYFLFGKDQLGCESLTTNTYRHLCEGRESADLTAAKKTFHLLVRVVDELWWDTHTRTHTPEPIRGFVFKPISCCSQLSHLIIWRKQILLISFFKILFLYKNLSGPCSSVCLSDSFVFLCPCLQISVSTSAQSVRLTALNMTFNTLNNNVPVRVPVCQPIRDRFHWDRLQLQK